MACLPCVLPILILTACCQLSTPIPTDIDLSDLQFDLEGCVVGEVAPGTLRRHLGYLAKMTSSGSSGDVIENIDSNSDGKICWCDLLELVQKSKDKAAKERHVSVPMIDVQTFLPETMQFPALDKDGDGYIRGGAELGTLLQRLTSCMGISRALEALQQMDSFHHKDMAISRQELQGYMMSTSALTSANPHQAQQP